MTWIKIDDGFTDHPKLVAVGPFGIALQMSALCHASRYLTNGFLTEDVVRNLSRGFRPRDAATGRDGSWGDLMVQHGLWEKDESRRGYLIHDYLKYNPTRDKVLADREAARTRKVRRKFARSSGEVRESSGEVREKFAFPVPVPVPLDSKSKGSNEPLSGLPDTGKRRPRAARTADRPPKPDYTAEAKRVLERLNQKANRHFRPVPGNLIPIIARLREGASVDDCFTVIARKCVQWRNDPTMAVFLRPITLFAASKFASYIGENPAAMPEASHGPRQLS